jgi:hypothetical protein
MKYELDIKPPMFPNFLTLTKGGVAAQMPVADLTDEQAAELWEAWRLLWLLHVSRKRNAPKTTYR